MPFAESYNGLRVAVTGHTGFKGSWLCEWLLQFGSKVYGFALAPQPHEVLFGQLALADRIEGDYRGDVRDLQSLEQFIAESQPQILFHLAAQPLVRLSYEIPAETFAVNLSGTVNVLEAVRKTDTNCCVVCVTTDKCYENREWVHAYREDDPMGGYDPYSASKGCAELAIAAYRRSFFSKSSKVRLASARAGNVVGGGDWAIDRIVPDCFRSLFANRPVVVRNRHATRPWQHVLEPLSGYLWLGSRLLAQSFPDMDHSRQIEGAFNFGPSVDSNRTVEDLVLAILRHVPGSWVDATENNAKHEASKLNLAIDKAHHLLSWRPTWDFNTTVEKTANWYATVQSGKCPQLQTQSQITEYQKDAANLGLEWAK